MDQKLKNKKSGNKPSSQGNQVFKRYRCSLRYFFTALLFFCLLACDTCALTLDEYYQKIPEPLLSKSADDNKVREMLVLFAPVVIEIHNNHLTAEDSSSIEMADRLISTIINLTHSSEPQQIYTNLFQYVLSEVEPNKLTPYSTLR